MSSGAGACTSSPCLHNGTCINNYYTNEYTCVCLAAYSGDRCEQPLLCTSIDSFPNNVNITLVRNLCITGVSVTFK